MTRTGERWRRWTAWWVLAGVLLCGEGVARLRAAELPPAPAAASSETTRGTADASSHKGLVPTTSFLEIMREGGTLMWVLAFCSVVLLTFVFERLVSLRRSRVIPKSFVTRFLQQVRDGSLDREKAMALCAENQNPTAGVFGAAVRKWGRPSMEVEQAIIDSGERAVNGLRKYLRVFTALTVIAPLLGLLGTVFGMIQAFNAVAASDALGRPELLAKGISQALLNTAFGLAVAIPAQSFYFFFVSRVDQLIMAIDGFGQELVNMISAEGLADREAEQTPKARRSQRREAEAQ